MNSLALKYRPKNFSELIGQLHAAKSLENAIEFKRVSHAYLFFGSRGVGKTSTARIFSKCLNCSTNGISKEPCGTCENCVEISEGRNIDVIEMDAASNRGIEHIRDLRENVRFSPMKSKHKVYIIDEVHMLTNEAFNALLKTLEEPPPHVVFLLATTEYHKIPETILSRCQSFAFKKFNDSEIVARLETILKSESIEYEKTSLIPVARKAEGSMRDAISLIDQVISYSGGESVKLSVVEEILGVIRFDVFIEFLQSILDQNLKTALVVLQKLNEEGRNLKQFVREFLFFLKNALLLKKEVQRPQEGFSYSEQNKKELEHLVSKVDTAHIILIFEQFYKLFGNWGLFQSANSAEVLISIEISIVDILQKLSQPSISQLVGKLANLEKSIVSGESFKDTPSPSLETKQPSSPAVPKPLSQKEPLLEKQNSPKDTLPEKEKVTEQTKPENTQENDMGQLIEKEFGGNEENFEKESKIFED